MDQPPPLPGPESPPTAAPAPTTSLAARLLNIFATPGEVFDEVRSTGSTISNWLVPSLIFAVVGAISAVVIFSQPAIIQQIHEQQAKAIDQQVQAGKMTRAQADQAMGMIEKFTGPTMMKIFGAGGAVFGSFVRLFWWALILWLLGRTILKSKFSYLKAAEVAGLTTMINVLGGIVGVLLIVNFGRLGATPSLALTVSDFDMKNKTHLLLAAANIFYFWQVGVMAAGLARLAGVPFARALLVVAGFWVLWELFLIMIGLGQFAM